MTSVDFIRTSIPVQVTRVLRFLQISTRSNFLISALQTNMVFAITSYNGRVIYYLSDATYFYDQNVSYADALVRSSCRLKSSLVPAGFYSLPLYESAVRHVNWPNRPPFFEPLASATVDGFFGGCNVLDALLASTLDCLYNITCLTNLVDYFPGLSQVMMCYKTVRFSPQFLLFVDGFQRFWPYFVFTTAESFIGNPFESVVSWQLDNEHQLSAILRSVCSDLLYLHWNWLRQSVTYCCPFAQPLWWSNYSSPPARNFLSQ